MASTSRRRGSLPAIKLSSAPSSTSTTLVKPNSKLPAISDTKASAQTLSTSLSEEGVKISTMEGGKLVPKDDTKMTTKEGAKQSNAQSVAGNRRRHSISSSSSPTKGNCVRTSLDKDTLTVTSARSDKVFKGRRHSVACIEPPKEPQSILKKERKLGSEERVDYSLPSPPLVGTELSAAWVPGRRGSVDADLPEGSDTFRLAMAEFLPQVEEVSATSPKNCGADEERVRVREPAKRIRWSEVVNVMG
jgi:hypothetical protein